MKAAATSATTAPPRSSQGKERGPLSPKVCTELAMP